MSVAQLVERSGLTEDELQRARRLRRARRRATSPRASWSFSARCVVTARTARRLRDDFALDDAHAVAIVLRFMQRIDALERRAPESLESEPLAPG